MAHPFEDFKDLHGATPAQITAAANKPGVSAKQLTQLGSDLMQDGSKSDAATEGDLKNIKNVPKGTSGKATKLGGAGYLAVGCLHKFGHQAEQFDTKVENLNEQVRNSTIGPLHDPDVRSGKVDIDLGAIRKACENRLRPKYNKLVNKLDGQAEGVAGMLKAGPGNTDNIRKLIRQGFIPLSAAAAFDGLKLSQQDKYTAFKSQIKNGTMPAFDKMTEEQRKSFVEKNPDLLKFLMSKKDPNEQVQADVIALALPHVNKDDGGKDGQDVLDIVDADGDPKKFMEKFGDTKAISDGLALLSPWLVKHNLSAAKDPAVKNSTVLKNAEGYLKGFVGKTGSHFKDVKEYIEDDSHKWKTGTKSGSYNPYSGGGLPVTTYDEAGGFSDGEKNDLFKAFGNGILGASDTRLGGSYDALPDEIKEASQETPMYTRAGMNSPSHMNDNDDFQDLAGILRHGNIEAGDGLSKNLAITTADTLEEYDNSEYSWDDHLGGDMLDLVGRNHEATTEVLTGDDMPQDYDNREFLKTVYGHEWSDDGAKAAGLTNWIGPASENPSEAALADKAHNGLMKELTSTGEDGIFKDIMGDGSEAAGETNPHMVESLMRNTRYHLDEMAADPKTGSSPLDAGERVRAMMLIASDRDSAKDMSIAVAAHHHDNIAEWVNGNKQPETAVAENGRLQSYLESGVFNEAAERDSDDETAEEARAKVIKAGIGAVGSMTGPAGGATSSLLSQVIEGRNPPPNDPNLFVENWSEDGSHLDILSKRAMVDALADKGKIDHNELPKELTDPDEETPTGDIKAALRQTLSGKTDALDEPLANREIYDKESGRSYDGVRDNWTASSDDELANLIEHGKMPGPG